MDISMLDKCKNRYEAEDMLRPLKKSEIEMIAKDLKIPVYIYKTKTKLIEKVVTDTVGERLKNEAIMSINLK